MDLSPPAGQASDPALPPSPLPGVRAERFWVRQGYQQVRLREGVEMGRLTNSLRVMVKPLGGHTVEDYLRLVERDRPAGWAPAA